MKNLLILVGGLAILAAGCESDDHHHRGGDYRGGYRDDVYRSYGHGEYRPGYNDPYRRPYERDWR